MSRVHITYRRLPVSGDAIQYDVLSPDFSQGSFEERSLGVVTIHWRQRCYSFAPSALWRDLQFVDVNRLADGSLDPNAPEEGINYAARIHRAMSARIEEGDFS